MALAAAVESTKRMLRHRGSTKIVLGAVAYLGFDMAVLQGSFVAIDAHPVPSFAVVSMCYLIGGLAGSIPLPANLGAVRGMAGMLILFGVEHNQAVAAVVLYQAIGYLVPLIGGRDRLPVPAPGIRLDEQRCSSAGAHSLMSSGGIARAGREPVSLARPGGS